MNRLPVDLGAASLPGGAVNWPVALVPGNAREPSLLRLAQSIEELNPEMARALCLSGLAAMTDPVEREAWRVRLAPWLDTGGGDDGDPLVVAA